MKGKGVVYLNPKSFNAWKERHKVDPGLNVQSLNQALAQKNIEKAIMIICKNFVKNKGDIAKNKDDAGKVLDAPKDDKVNAPKVHIDKEAILLNHEQIIAKAEEQFEDNPFKNEILKKIKSHLEEYKRSGSITLGDDLAMQFNTQEARDKHQSITEGLDAFFSRRDLFQGVKIGALGGCVIGHRRFINELMQQAEIFIKEVALMPGQDADKVRPKLLNYIRAIIYKQKFVSDPKTYMENWKQARGLDERFRFLEDKAIEFFEKTVDLT